MDMSTPPNHTATAGSRRAAPGAASSRTPGYAPVPPSALGPALNADGYFAGSIDDTLHWVTDSFYQAMFLTTPEGVVLVDAPPTHWPAPRCARSFGPPPPMGCPARLLTWSTRIRTPITSAPRPCSART